MPSPSDPRNPCLGIDVGGTKIKMALIDGQGKILAAQRRVTPDVDQPKEALAGIVDTARELMKRSAAAPLAVGLGIAGQIDSQRGVLRSSPNLRWQDVDLRTPLEQAFELPTVIINDVRAATFGEWKFGAGRNLDNVLCLFIGTGVGAGCIVNGQPLEATNVPTMELGHVPLVYNGRPCSCRHRGCLEAYVGGWAIAKRARELAEDDREGASAVLSQVDTIAHIEAKHVAIAAQNGSDWAQSILAETGHYLGAAAVGMVNTFHPQRFVLGGGVVSGFPELTRYVNQAVQQSAFEVFTENFEAVQAECGADAGVIGAAELARHSLDRPTGASESVKQLSARQSTS